MLDGANTSALVLAQAVDSFSRSEQRWEFANTAATVAVLSVALAAIVLFCFRPRTRDLTLIYFSLFCILYAVRLFAYLPSFRSLFDWSLKFWSYVAWVISSVLIFPGGLFFYQVVGKKNSIHSAGVAQPNESVRYEGVPEFRVESRKFKS